jgi:hypothetical protein
MSEWTLHPLNTDRIKIGILLGILGIVLMSPTKLSNVFNVTVEEAAQTGGSADILGDSGRLWLLRRNWLI